MGESDSRRIADCRSIFGCLALSLLLPVGARADLAFSTITSRSLATLTVESAGGGTTEFAPIDRPPTNLGGFDIVINAGATLAANAPALAAFDRAAAAWEAMIADPITVTIDADLGALDPGIIGEASSVTLTASYSTIRNAMVVDAMDEFDDGVAELLPTAAQYGVIVPLGFGFGGLSATKANLKALGFTGLDASFGVSDAMITFSTNFSFDYDSSNGVGAGLTDFETVAAHEIGHALGFISDVDYIDFAIEHENDMPPDDPPPPPKVTFPTTLDMFRFDDGGATDPGTLAEFTTFPRSMVPGNAEIFDQIIGSFGGAQEGLLSTGVSQGDGRQASHWKDNNLTGLLLGMMDPTLASEQIFLITQNDLRALDLIGYEINAIPEGAGWLFGALATSLGGLAYLWQRKRAG